MECDKNCINSAIILRVLKLLKPEGSLMLKVSLMLEVSLMSISHERNHEGKIVLMAGKYKALAYRIESNLVDCPDEGNIFAFDHDFP